MFSSNHCLYHDWLFPSLEFIREFKDFDAEYVKHHIYAWNDNFHALDSDLQVILFIYFFFFRNFLYNQISEVSQKKVNSPSNVMNA